MRFLWKTTWYQGYEGDQIQNQDDGRPEEL